MLSSFAVSLTQSVRPVTIKVYLSAIKNLHLELGYVDPTEGAHFLKRVVRGICRCHGVAAVRPRLPITFPILCSLVDTCLAAPTMCPHDKRCLHAAMLAVFFGFFRCGELLEAPTTRGCLTFESGMLHGHLPRSKTDPSGEGTTVLIGPAVPPYCAVRAMLTYLTATASARPGSAVFILANGQRLNRSTFTAHVRTLLSTSGVANWQDYAGHSFRIGAATTAALAGVPDHQIRSAGRWRSDACLRYIRTPPSSARTLASKLSSVRSSP
ncbi:uncharacterized protein LOC135810397 [Sycon ciliatum]|uniref:uncharacterized protein LOC135810397 n=1 Tax=Sycon ciliatum TaxID=27933 RepID=UPI0031F62FBE